MFDARDDFGDVFRIQMVSDPFCNRQYLQRSGSHMQVTACRAAFATNGLPRCRFGGDHFANNRIRQLMRVRNKILNDGTIKIFSQILLRGKACILKHCVGGIPYLVALNWIGQTAASVS